MQRWKLWLILAALGVAAAYSNASTAMASASFVHGFLLNPIVAAVEALLFALMFRVSYFYSFFALLLVNYGSYFLGVLLNRPLSLMVGYPLYWLFGDATWYWTLILPLALLGAMALMYALTVVSEALMMRLKLPTWRAAIRASAIVNTVSYVGLLGFYGYWSDWGFLSLPKEPNAEFVKTVPATIYFIDWQKRVCTVAPTGGEVKFVHNASSDIPSYNTRGRSSSMGLVLSDADNTEAELSLPGSPKPVRLKLPYPPKAVNLRTYYKPSKQWIPRRFPDWRTEPSPYSFELVSFRGMTVFKDGRPHLAIRMNLPFNVDPGQEDGYFVVSGPSVLPGDYIVYEFAGRVMITHLPTGRTAKLADGFAPFAIVTAK